MHVQLHEHSAESRLAVPRDLGTVDLDCERILKRLALDGKAAFAVGEEAFQNREMGLSPIVRTSKPPLYLLWGSTYPAVGLAPFLWSELVSIYPRRWVLPDSATHIVIKIEILQGPETTSSKLHVHIIGDFECVSN